MRHSILRIAHSGGSLFSAKRSAAALRQSSEILKYFCMSFAADISPAESRRKVKHS